MENQFHSSDWVSSFSNQRNSDQSKLVSYLISIDHTTSFQDEIICFKLRPQIPHRSFFFHLSCVSQQFLPLPLDDQPFSPPLTGFRFSWLGISRPRTVFPIVPVSVSSVGVEISRYYPALPSAERTLGCCGLGVGVVRLGLASLGTEGQTLVRTAETCLCQQMFGRKLITCHTVV